MHVWTYEELRNLIPAEAAVSIASDPDNGSLHWLKAVWSIPGLDTVPFYAVRDVGAVLYYGRDFSFRSFSDETSAQREGRLQYEKSIVGRFLADSSVLRIVDTLTDLPDGLRGPGFVHALGLALAKFKFSGARRNPAMLSRINLTEDPPEDWSDWARDELASWVCGVDFPHPVFTAAEVWEIEHLDALPLESTRRALRAVMSYSKSIGDISSSTILNARTLMRQVVVDNDDKDVYPTGGFDAISTRGTFENLVRSEVAYVGEGDDGSGIDLFDVRFAENELLFYTRDESPRLDVLRDVAVVIDRPSEFRVKHQTLPNQHLVLIEGIALAFHADLVKVFGVEGARLNIVWRCESKADEAVAAEEQGLLSLPFASAIAQNRVQFHTVSDWNAVPGTTRYVFSPYLIDDEKGRTLFIQVVGASWGDTKTKYDMADHECVRRLVDNMILMSATPQTKNKTKRKRAR